MDKWLQKLDWKVDIEKMRKQLEVAKAMYNATYDDHGYGPMFGGLGILSDTGDWDRGMISGKQVWKEGKIDFKLAIEKGINFEYNYDKKTSLCVGETEKLIDRLEKIGLTPRRARYTVLKACGKSSVHNDSKRGEYATRLHVPLITNDSCFHRVFEGDKVVEEVFLPADGSIYIMRVNIKHQIVNDSNQDRWHFLCSIYDQNGLTDFPITKNEMNVVKVKAEAFKNGVKWVEGGETLFEDPTRISPTHPPDLGSST